MKILRPSSTPFRFSLRHPTCSFPKPQSRPFVTSLSPPVQTITASRTLPYPSAQIYTIVADVPSYATFLPYCTGSTVTRWSKPDPQGHKWPEEAELRVGWGGIEERFKSRIYCVPGRVVEAVAGKTRTRLRAEEVRHHSRGEREMGAERGGGNGGLFGFGVGGGDGMFTHLLSRWTIRPLSDRHVPNEGKGAGSREHTVVNLAIEFQFHNPVYSAMSSAVADRVAGVLIEAFEKRVKSLMDGQEVERERAGKAVGG